MLIFLFLISCSHSLKKPEKGDLEALGFQPISDISVLPNIEFTDEDGVLRTLADYRGSVVLLNFWASWCPPCRAEMPAMGRLAQELTGNDFAMIPINLGEKAEIVAAFVEEFDIDFPVYLDEKTESAQMIGIHALPTSILLDREGQGIAVITGVLEWDSNAMVELFKRWSQ